jgi:hypothetical protein
MSTPSLLPEIQEPTSSTGARWKVTIFNDDHILRDDVLDVLLRATGCDAAEAEIEIWEAEKYGKAAVHFANHPECESAAWIIGRIGVKTEVSLEWED